MCRPLAFLLLREENNNINTPHIYGFLAEAPHIPIHIYIIKKATAKKNQITAITPITRKPGWGEKRRRRGVRTLQHQQQHEHTLSFMQTEGKTHKDSYCNAPSASFASAGCAWQSHQTQTRMHTYMHVCTHACSAVYVHHKRAAYK